MMHTDNQQSIVPTFLPAPTSIRGSVCALSVLALALAGCAKERPSADSSAAAAPAQTGSMKDMSMEGKRDAGAMRGMKGMMGGDSGGMAGMRGMSGMTGMMGDMQKQMDGMMKLSPDQMKAMMPAHRQMVANMLSEMTAEMRKMNMSGDAAWTATADSVRQDLVHMPELSGRELVAAMPAYRARTMRLMEKHRAMSTNMKM